MPALAAIRAVARGALRRVAAGGAGRGVKGRGVRLRAVRPVEAGDGARPRALRVGAVGAAVLAPLAVVPWAAAASASWRAPVPGAVVGAFSFSPASPYVAGARRGLDLAARTGEAVRAPCGGRVRFAGDLPGGRRAVTVRCGGLVATVLGLSATAVHRGAVVAAGDRLGPAAGVVRLGARRVGERDGYVDPAPLLAVPGRTPPAAAPPPARHARRAPPAVAPLAGARPAPGPSLRPAARRRPEEPARTRPTGRREAAPEAPRVPPAAWFGLGLAAAGLGGGAARARRGRRRRRAGAAAVPGLPRAGR